MSRVDGNLQVTGSLQVGSFATKVARTDLEQTVLAVYPLPLSLGVTHDAPQTRLPGTSSGNDLAIVGGTYGTDATAWETADLKGLGATSNYGRFPEVPVPVEFDSGHTMKVRISGGMITTVADTAATVDVEVFKSGRDGAKTGSDLVSTAAQSINSLTFADLDFTVDTSTLSPGDILDVRVTVLVNDGATGTEVKGRVGAVELLADIRG